MIAMKKLLTFAFITCIGFVSKQSSYAQSPQITTQYGIIEGYTQDNIQIFKGIPFAAPPVGELRWKNPVAPSKWNGVKKCTEFAASPIQSTPTPFLCWSEEFIAPAKPLSEDCLYLNIWNKKDLKKNKAVFVWIYGGGFSSGSAACAIYDGKHYAENDIVFVSLNYRVGALGFMAHPDLTKENNGSSGNYGIMDQVAALQWVHDNIAQFGGDPNNVTIAGQSAGSMSVNCLIATPKAKGLFKKAIAQSGGILGGIGMTSLQDAEKTGVTLQEKLHANSLQAMRQLPADTILKYSSTMGGLRFSPIGDGQVLPMNAEKAFKEGHINQIKLMSGWVLGDGALFGNANTDKENFIKTIQQRYPTKSEKILALLPHETKEEATKSLDLLNLINFAIASPHKLAKYLQQPTYMYQFSHMPVDKPGFPNYGVFHTSEVPYALGNLSTWKRPWVHLDYEVEKTMSQYWINFIKTNNPNNASLPKWEVYNNGTTLEIGDSIKSISALYKDLLETL
jgi:para-nitrobenzyl esterase